MCGVASRDKERNGRGATRGGMAHEEQNDPVAQSSTSKSPTTSTADLSERDNKENPVVKVKKNFIGIIGIGIGSSFLELHSA